MPKPKVHMMVIVGEDEDHAVCGLWFVASPTLNWKEVTCKSCLKKKPADA